MQSAGCLLFAFQWGKPRARNLPFFKGAPAILQTLIPWSLFLETHPIDFFEPFTSPDGESFLFPVYLKKHGFCRAPRRSTWWPSWSGECASRMPSCSCRWPWNAPQKLSTRCPSCHCSSASPSLSSSLFNQPNSLPSLGVGRPLGTGQCGAQPRPGSRAAHRRWITD